MAPVKDEEQYLQECVTIEPLAIQEEYIRLPADMSYWNARYADAVRVHLHAKHELERVEAQQQLEQREKLAAEGKKPTEAMVSASVLLSDEYNKAKLTAIEAEVGKMRAAGRVDDLHSKREMLISMGAHIRKEMDGDPVLREQMKGARVNKDGNW